MWQNCENALLKNYRELASQLQLVGYNEKNGKSDMPETLSKQSD
ncbi:hypothetical protein [Sediminibacillus halophilus]|nr:hypothetical protein [Sediminibacillus halophilus]